MIKVIYTNKGVIIESSKKQEIYNSPTQLKELINLLEKAKDVLTENKARLSEESQSSLWTE